MHIIEAYNVEGLSNYDVDMSRELENWWETHKENDRKHEEQKILAQKQRSAQKRALAKLTKEERKALGL
jgi:hypothetical protein